MTAVTQGAHLDALPLVERRSARARRISVIVRPQGDVVLTIPRWATRRQAHAFLEQSLPWIARQQERWRERGAAHAARALRWDGADTLTVRGESLPLRVAVSGDRRSRGAVNVNDVTLHVPAARVADAGHLRKVLVRTLREAAMTDAQRLLQLESARLGLMPGALRLRDPRTLWGSCGRDGSIMLSWRLVLAPPAVLRYVVVHELCHLRYRSHGPRFWALMERAMPDYAVHRRWLRDHGHALHGAP